MVSFFRKNRACFPIYDETRPLTVEQIDTVKALDPPILIRDNHDYAILKHFIESYEDSDGEDKDRMSYGG